jgi:hypothetical protein
MKSVLYGLAALPFFAGIALAGQPTQLSDTQMDKVTAGWDALFSETSNTSVTGVSVYNSTPATTEVAANTPSGATAAVYLDIENGTFSVASAFLQFPKP